MAAFCVGLLVLLLPALRSTGLSNSNIYQANHGGRTFASQSENSINTRPIESLHVGERVLAKNPEIDSQLRDQISEPNWSEWMHLSLALPISVSSSDTVSVIEIELLRSREWLEENLVFALAAEPQLSSQDSLASPSSVDIPLVIDPVLRELKFIAKMIESMDTQIVGVCVHLDLPEMGANGLAIVKNVQRVPDIASGPGSVITATFRHPPATQVVSLQIEGDSEPIGVTSNHLFWHVDKQCFTPVEQMQVGDRLLDLRGEIRRITAIQPRPGPRIVYNLEVFGEHVYFVGTQAVLAHNNYDISAKIANRTATRAEWQAFNRAQRLAPVSVALPRTLQQQKELAHLTAQARSELVNNFDELARALSPHQMRAIADEPWRMRLFFGTVLETRVAAKVRDAVRTNPQSVLSDLRWTGRTNAPQDFIGPGGFGFDITGNSMSSIQSHYARKQVQAVVTYDSIPSDLGRRFVRWMSQ